MSDFIFYPGKNNILLIAPHGRPEDDINTGELTKKLAKRLDCYAAINEKFRKPDKESEEVTNADLHIADLNNKKSITEAGLMADWFEEIEISKKAILDDIQEEGIVGTCYIFLIHGAKDENVEAVSHGADVLLGIGRSKDESGVKKDRPTTTEDNLKNFIEALKNEGSIEAVEAKAAQKDTDDKENWYAGHDKYNLNQCFVERPNGVLDPKIQSFQVEIKNSSFRDNDESIKNTASRLAAAIGKLTGVVPVLEGEILDEKNEVLPVDTKEIDDAVIRIIDSYQTAAVMAMIEVGNYLVEHFFNNDFEAAKNTRNVTGNESIRQIHQKLKEKIGSPSKSWVYNSIKVSVDERTFRDMNFHTYGHLPLSHKVRLAYVPEKEVKKELAQLSCNHDWTVKQLSEEIRSRKQIENEKKGLGKKSPYKMLSSLLSKPERLLEADDQTFKQKFDKLKEKQKKKLKDKASKKVEVYVQQIKKLEKLKGLYEKIGS